MTEALAIEAFKNGDMKALGWIYERHRAAFVNWYTFEYRCPVGDATDMYQRVTLTFYENVTANKFSEPQNENSLRSYFKTIGKNKQSEDWRKQKKTLLGNNDDFTDLSDIIFDEEQQNEIEKQLDQLPKALLSLGDPCKTMLEYFYFHKLSDIQICEKVGYSNTDSVKTGRYKCIQRLKKIIFKM
jgi:RNA polymerase sigma factor (sigma-70 family)